MASCNLLRTLLTCVLMVASVVVNCADLAIAQSFGYQAQHFHFPRGQRVRRRRFLGQAPQLFQHLHGNARIQRGFAAADLLDGPDQVARFGILEQVPIEKHTTFILYHVSSEKSSDFPVRVLKKAGISSGSCNPRIYRSGKKCSLVGMASLALRPSLS